MIVGSIKEDLTSEKRISITPETAKNIMGLGLKVCIEKDYATHLGIEDNEYKKTGVDIKNSSSEVLNSSNLIVKVNCPSENEISLLKEKTILIGMLNPSKNKDQINKIIKKKIKTFSLELLPRITRAQSMDVLSSQSNLAGYRAVIDCVAEFEKAVPMMMTAAGTVPAAKVLIIGAGVAGLQAIATAKRLGAVVEASDVRPSVKEQIESLGAKFIDVPLETEEEIAAAEGEGGYAKAMPASWLKRQSERVAEKIAKADMVISTALIPGKKAPLLITNDMVQSMKPGSVIVDMAVEQGGNCEGSEIDTIKELNGVKVIGFPNLPAMVSSDSSALYSRNIYDFARLIISEEKTLVIPDDDDIVQATLVIKEGQLWKP